MNTVKRSTYGKGGVTSSGEVTETTTVIDQATINAANLFNPPPYWIIASSIFGGMTALVAVVVIIIIITMNVKDGEDPEVFPEISDTAEVDQEDLVDKKPLKTTQKATKKVEDNLILEKLHNHDDKKVRDEHTLTSVNALIPGNVQKPLAVPSTSTAESLEGHLATTQAFFGFQESTGRVLNPMPQGHRSQITVPTFMARQATTYIPPSQKQVSFPSCASNQFYPDVVSQARQNTSQV